MLNTERPVVNMSAGNRQPSGKRRPKYVPRHAGSNNIKFRITHDWDRLRKLGADPILGSAVGIMHLDGILTDAEADAAVYYAEVAGRYDRFHPCKDGAPRTARAQSYNFGSRAADTEIERHNRDGTISSYERRAKKTQKLWADIHKVIPPTITDRIDQLCLMDQRPNEQTFDAIKASLLAIYQKFLRGRATRESRIGKAKQQEPRSAVLKKHVLIAIGRIMDDFIYAAATPKTFQLCAGKSELGVKVFGADAVGKPATSTVMVALRRDDLAANVASMFLKQCQAQGWTDHPKATE